MLLKKFVLTGWITLAAIIGFAQQKTLTLDEALASAQQHYPALKQKELLKEIEKENQSLLNASLLPQLGAAGQATYQSEVTAFEMPGIPKGIGQKPDNYNIGFDLRLPLTQFGIVHSKKELEAAQADAGIMQLDVEFQKVKERITGLFGNLLLQKANERILKVRLNDLDSQARKVSVGVNSGAVLKSNQLVLESEILGTQQRIEDIQSTEKSLMKQLALLTNIKVDTATDLLLEQASLEKSIHRPEITALEAQKKVLDIRGDLVKKESKPNFYLFGQGNFGRPGFNFLNTDPRLYGIAGIGLSWNINNLFNVPKQQHIIKMQKDQLNAQEETFRLNLEASLAEKEEEIRKFGSIISKDAQIVQKRKEIMRATESQLQNGVITSTEYLTELNAANSAELNLVLHKVQLAMAIAQYNTISGN